MPARRRPDLLLPVLSTLFLTLAACSDSPTGPRHLLDGHAELDGGALTVRGGAGAHQIRIDVTAQGVEVDRDGERTVVQEPVRAIEVQAGGGANVVRFHQSLVADIELTILSGDGGDDIAVSFEPAGVGDAGDRMDVTVAIDTGEGSDRFDFRFNGTALPALNAYAKLTFNGTAFLPEVADEVLVSFESGDPDRPIVIGAVWNGRGTDAGGSPADGRRTMDLEAELGPESADFGLTVRGGAGPDEVEVTADYSGAPLQQGRILLDADMNEGDNHVGTYIVTSATHTRVTHDIVAGNGRNVVAIDNALGGGGELIYSLALGDGDNETTIRFGDGIHGARPSPAERTVTAAYRSGTGTNTVNVEGDVRGPMAGELTLDFQGGQNTTNGVHRLVNDWPTSSSPSPDGAQPLPSQLKVTLAGGGENELDFRVELPDAEVEEDEQAAPGEVVVLGSGGLQGRLDFLRLLGSQPSPADGSAPGSAIVYLQEQVALAPNAALGVAIHGRDGDDDILAHLIDLSGEGRFTFLADGGGGSDVVAALTRALEPEGGGERSFELRGADGDDTLALASPPEPDATARIIHRIDGGAGTNSCFAPSDVLSQDCGRREGITQEVLDLLRARFGEAYAAAWPDPEES